MNFKKFFLEDTKDPDSFSMMRLGFFIMIGMAVILAGVEGYCILLLTIKFITVLNGNNLIKAQDALLFFGVFVTLNTLIIGLLTAAFGGKFGQKWIENKFDNTNQENQNHT